MLTNRPSFSSKYRLVRPEQQETRAGDYRGNLYSCKYADPACLFINRSLFLANDNG